MWGGEVRELQWAHAKVERSSEGCRECALSSIGILGLHYESTLHYIEVKLFPLLGIALYSVHSGHNQAFWQ